MTEDEKRKLQEQIGKIDFSAIGKDLSASTTASGRGDYKKAQDLAAGQSAGVLGATTDKTSADIKTDKEAQEIIERPEESASSKGFAKLANLNVPKMEAYRPGTNLGRYSTDVDSDVLAARRKAIMDRLKQG